MNSELILFFAFSIILSWILWIPSILSGKGYDVPGVFLFIGVFAVFGQALPEFFSPLY